MGSSFTSRLISRLTWTSLTPRLRFLSFCSLSCRSSSYRNLVVIFRQLGKVSHLESLNLLIRACFFNVGVHFSAEVDDIFRFWGGLWFRGRYSISTQRIYGMRIDKIQKFVNALTDRSVTKYESRENGNVFRFNHVGSIRDSFSKSVQYEEEPMS